MNTQPVYTIGTVITATEIAVVSVLTVIVLAMGLQEDAPLAIAITGAGSGLTLAIGNIIGYYMTHQQVTSVTSPNLPINTLVNEHIKAPTGIVTAVED